MPRSAGAICDRCQVGIVPTHEGVSQIDPGSRQGCPLLDTPRTDPDEPNSSIRLLPWVFDGEALIGPGMKGSAEQEASRGPVSSSDPT